MNLLYFWRNKIKWKYAFPFCKNDWVGIFVFAVAIFSLVFEEEFHADIFEKGYFLDHNLVFLNEFVVLEGITFDSFEDE